MHYSLFWPKTWEWGGNIVLLMMKRSTCWRRLAWYNDLLDMAITGGLRREYIMPILVVLICNINFQTFVVFLPFFFWEGNRLIFWGGIGDGHWVTFKVPRLSEFWNPLRSCQQTQIAAQLKTVTLKKWERILRICYRTRKLVLSSLGKEKSRNERNCKGCFWEKTVAMTKRGAKRIEETKKGYVSNCNQQNVPGKGCRTLCQAAKCADLASQGRAWIPYRENV